MVYPDADGSHSAAGRADLDGLAALAARPGPGNGRMVLAAPDTAVHPLAHPRPDNLAYAGDFRLVVESGVRP